MLKSLAFVGIIVALILVGVGIFVEQAGSRFSYGDGRVDELVEKQSRISTSIGADPNTLMSKDVDELERRLASTIAELVRKDGSQSRLAAVLKLRLGRLYQQSGHGNGDVLIDEATSVLKPMCLQCKKNDSTVAHSPPPDQPFEQWLNGTWWTCRRCDPDEKKPFRASSDERVYKTLAQRIGITRGDD